MNGPEDRGVNAVLTDKDVVLACVHALLSVSEWMVNRLTLHDVSSQV